MMQEVQSLVVPILPEKKEMIARLFL